MIKNQQASPKKVSKTSKHIKKPSKALKEAAKIVGSLGGRPRKESSNRAFY